MRNKVTLEDHFAIDATLQDSKLFGGAVWDELSACLLDLTDKRVRLMDAAGIETMIVSLNAPAIQGIPDAKRATDVARAANDALAEATHKQPKRLVGVAALAMQDPEGAARELERCVRDLGFKGALVNGFSQLGDKILYYDLPIYRPFWAAVERLDVPFYLHPRNPMPNSVPAYEGHPWLNGPTWGFHAETAVHALRLIGSGLYDEHPRLKMVLGHLGEGLPFYLWRIDNRNAWMKARHPNAAKHPVAHYVRSNFHVTTSGHFSTNALRDAISELGADRVMFSADYPFENLGQAAEWFDSATLSDEERVKIGRDNAARLFKL